MQTEIQQLRQEILKLKLESPWDTRLPKLIQKYDQLLDVQSVSPSKVK